MRNNIISIILIILLSNMASGNPIKILGIIKDSESHKPVSFANVAIVEVKKGTSSDYNGIFELNIDSSDLNRNLYISCLNYKDLRIKISELTIGKRNEISLEKRIYEVPEIVVSSKKEKKKEITLNKLKKSKINGRLTCYNLPLIHARYFPYDSRLENVNHIKYINIAFKKCRKKKKSKVRIRILSNHSEYNMPDKDILCEDLIVFVKSGITKIDISKYNITMPRDGVFVSVEWLIIEENKYDDIYYNHKTRTFYAPILGANYYQQSSTWIYWAGHWEKYEEKVPLIHPKIKAGSYFDAAISLTLSNQ